VDEASPPRRVAKISIFHGCCEEGVLLMQRWSRRIDDLVGLT
jgi:hypothetical protein